MKWIWPFSWYFRIRELEAQLAEQRYLACEMEKRLRSQAMVEMSMSIMYTSSLAAIAATYESYSNTQRREP